MLALLNYEDKLLVEIGKIFKRYRSIKGFTQKEFAEGICDGATVSRIETGIQKAPNIILLNKLALKLGLTFTSVVERAEAQIKDQTFTIKRKILHLISLGKYYEAELLIERLNLNYSDDYKYYCLIKGSIKFFEGEYKEANNYFFEGLNKFTNLTSKTVFTYIEIFLFNAYFANLLKLEMYNLNTICTKVHLKYLYVQKQSIEYYLVFEPRTVIRLKIFLLDFFRIFGIYDVYDALMKEIDPVLDEFLFLENKIDLTHIKAVYYYQINKPEMAIECIEKTRVMLKAFDMIEIEEYFNKMVIGLTAFLKTYKSSFTP